MKKTLSILLIIILVSMTFVSCSDELLAKAGSVLKSFAGTDSKYSEKEIEEQTEVVKEKANAMSSFLGAEDLKITSDTDTSVLDAFIDSLIDNPACDVNEKTGIEVGKINEMLEANNPILGIMSILDSTTSETDIKTSMTNYVSKVQTSMTDMVKDSLGEDVATTLNNILDVFKVLPTDSEKASSEKATVKDVATAAAAAKMGSALTKLADIANGDGIDDISSITDIVTEYDNAARSYMAITGKTNLSIMDAINIETLMGN